MVAPGEWELSLLGCQAMPEAPSRFDAQAIARVATLTERGALEIEFVGSAGGTHVLSLPLARAVELSRLISDLSHHAPYLIGNPRRSDRNRG